MIGDLDLATRLLRGDGPENLGQRIHESRKAFKRIRAHLRLVRKPLGPDYPMANRMLRDCGRALSRVRDREVLIGTLDGLRDGSESEAVADELAAPVIAELLLRFEAARQADLREGRTFAEILLLLERLRELAPGWELRQTPPMLFRAGLHRNYRRAHRAFAIAYYEDTAASFHELRKRVKYLKYQARILAPASPAEIGAVADRADRLGELLGDDHDLSVLRVELTTIPEQVLGPQGAATLDAAAVQRSRRLRERARPLAARLVGEQPGAFAERIAIQYRAWMEEGGA